MLGENPQHLNKNSAEVSPHPPLQRTRLGADILEERQTCETIVIKYLYFLVEYLSFYF